ncbi:MAG: hypothetical protein IPM06_21100 [Rhizobiales bacterium]|nr:hypothetical protein [Hyphomicrobiales bacterium]
MMIPLLLAASILDLSGTTITLQDTTMPGAGDRDAWGQIIADSPLLAPASSLDEIIRHARRLSGNSAGPFKAAAEPELRLMAHGLAYRSRALRLLGNGVVSLVAAHAFRSLAAAHGIRPLDLEADDQDGCTDAGRSVRGIMT